MTLKQQLKDVLEERFRPQPVSVAGFTDGTLLIRLLSENEVCDARIAAHKHLEEKCKREEVRLLDHIEVDAGAFERERMRQIVSRAFLTARDIDPDFEDHDPAFTPAQVRKLDTVLLDELFDVYLGYQAAKTVRVERDPTEVQAFVDEIKKNGGEAVLSVLDENALRVLVLALVRRGD